MSATTVAIKPTAKSTLAKLWAGIFILAIFALALAYAGTNEIQLNNKQFMAENAKNDDVTTTDSGLQIKTIKAGEGPSPAANDVVLVKYKGMLKDGTVFDEADQAPFPVTGVVPGFSEALQKMQKGGEYKIWIPSELGYGSQDVPDPQTGGIAIAGGSMLIFEITLIDFKTQAEVEAIRKQAEKLQSGAGGAGSAGGLPQGLPPELQAQLEQQLRQSGR